MSGGRSYVIDLNTATLLRMDSNTNTDVEQFMNEKQKQMLHVWRGLPEEDRKEIDNHVTDTFNPILISISYTSPKQIQREDIAKLLLSDNYEIRIVNDVEPYTLFINTNTGDSYIYFGVYSV